VPDNDIAKFGHREQSNATELDVWIAKHARET
jgi:hypothetical protein